MKMTSNVGPVSWQSGRAAITVIMPVAEWEMVKELADKLGQSYRGLIRRLILEEGEKYGMVPDYESTIRDEVSGITLKEVNQSLKKADDDIAKIEDCLARHPVKE